MPKVSDIPRLKAGLVKLYDKGLITDAHFNATADSLFALERKEALRVNSIAKRENDRRLAENLIDSAQWLSNWRDICAAREAL